MLKCNIDFDKLVPSTKKAKPQTSKTIEVIVYPYDLPVKYARRDDESDEQFAKRFALAYASDAGIHSCFNAYAIFHFGELYTQEDYDAERRRISAYYHAVRNGDKKLIKVLLSTANNEHLYDFDSKQDALDMTEEEFLGKYCYIQNDWIDKKFKRDHFHFVFHYDYTNNYLFNVNTIAERMKEYYFNDDGKLSGILNPYIPFGDINNAVRYLAHLDSPSKKKYKPKDIICINCNDAMERIAKGAPIDYFGDQCIYLKKIAVRYNITDYPTLLEAIRTNCKSLYQFACSDKGQRAARYATKAAYFKASRELHEFERQEQIRLQEELNNKLISAIMSLSPDLIFDNEICDDDTANMDDTSDHFDDNDTSCMDDDFEWYDANDHEPF